MTTLPVLHRDQGVVDLSVLIPCYNDSANLAKNIEGALEDLDSLVQQTYELIVIDDGSTDATYLEACRVASGNPHARVVRTDSNVGKGAALQAGFEVSKGALICFLDGDLQISARNIPRFIEYMRLEQADVVIGSKRHPLSTVDYPQTRRFLSRFYQVLITTLFGLPLKDSQAGLKLFRREVLGQVFPKALVKRYAFDVEVLSNAHRLGHRILEAPIEIAGGGAYESHVNLAAVWRMLWDTLGIFYRMYIRGYYDESSGQVPPSRKMAILGPALESLIPARYFAAKGIDVRLIPSTETGSTEAALGKLAGDHFELTLVCVRGGGGEPVKAEAPWLRSHLRLLAKMLEVSHDYQCVAFTGTLYPGTTRETIVPYLEHMSKKRIEEDFDVVVLPPFEEMSRILPQSRQPQSLLVGSTSPRGVSALSHVMRELEPIMIRTDPSTAEVVHHVRRLIRSNTQPLTSQILDVCSAEGADTELVLRSAQI